MAEFLRYFDADSERVPTDSEMLTARRTKLLEFAAKAEDDRDFVAAADLLERADQMQKRMGYRLFSPPEARDSLVRLALRRPEWWADIQKEVADEREKEAARAAAAESPAEI